MFQSLNWARDGKTRSAKVKSSFSVYKLGVIIVLNPAPLADCKPFKLSSIAMQCLASMFSLLKTSLYTSDDGFFFDTSSLVAIALKILLLGTPHAEWTKESRFIKLVAVAIATFIFFLSLALLVS